MQNTKVDFINNKVYRPSGPWTKQVHTFLRYLREKGFNKAPEPLGFDEEGREIVSFVKGQTNDYPLCQNTKSLNALASCANLLRELHDTSKDFLNTAPYYNGMLPCRNPQEFICHNDFAPYNICFEREQAVGIIDFDTASPGPRIWDIAYALYRFAPFSNPQNTDGFGTLEEQISRARLFCEAYGLPQENRSGITDLMIERLENLLDFMTKSAQEGNKKFELTLQQGHHLKYLADIEYIKRHKLRIENVLNGLERQDIVLPQTTIRALTQSDIPTLVSCFAQHNWPKPSSTFEQYLKEQSKGERLVWIAYVNKELAGYNTLKWQSKYKYFRKKQIPEIMDLNVLPPFRKCGVGSTLLDIAETTAITQTHLVGLGVGLYDGYGHAQKLYVKRGYIPDGCGITYNYEPLVPGSHTVLDDDLILWFTKKLK
jgi:GNAT superfamily N-acetyltransferase